MELLIGGHKIEYDRELEEQILPFIDGKTFNSNEECLGVAVKIGLMYLKKQYSKSNLESWK